MQISFSPYKLREMTPVLEYCKKHGIIIEAYSSLLSVCVLASPASCLTALLGMPLDTQHLITICTWISPITRQPNGPVDEPVRKAAERLKATPGQVLLLWARQKGCVIVTSVVPVLILRRSPVLTCSLLYRDSRLFAFYRTSSKQERLDEYLAVADLRTCKFLSLSCDYRHKFITDCLSSILQLI